MRVDTQFFVLVIIVVICPVTIGYAELLELPAFINFLTPLMHVDGTIQLPTSPQQATLLGRIIKHDVANYIASDASEPKMMHTSL
ncbi:hypothetical protein CJ030_MR1G014042 [Morella rubra]|uniref:Uncharacterized protein n=1 Tax=Morella rubra TaxID=262757 RepID=A0A6A1WUQ4_9ROSI|nr:hypothetical protein CJ030_MR1G014042 [Morella rubra]